MRRFGKRHSLLLTNKVQPACDSRLLTISRTKESAAIQICVSSPPSVLPLLVLEPTGQRLRVARVSRTRGARAKAADFTFVGTFPLNRFRWPLRKRRPTRPVH